MSTAANTKRNIKTAIVTAVVFLTFYLTIRLWNTDLSFDLIPGWHTVGYPSDVSLALIALLMLMTVVLTYFLVRALRYVAARISSRAH